jgi:hypothetical protein
MLLKSFARSPPIESVLAYTLAVFCSSVALNIAVLGTGIHDAASSIGLGLVLYSFLEYVFHRVVLHSFLWEEAHKNHHRHPSRLRIICTPMLPVLLYGLVMTYSIAPLVGAARAIGLFAGLGLGQLLMDTVHIVQHSTWHPWWLEVSRSWHSYHHQQVHWDECHGLTCFFWDAVFGTWPSAWPLAQRFPFVRFMQLPLPLVSSIITWPLLFRLRVEQRAAAACRLPPRPLHAAPPSVPSAPTSVRVFSLSDAASYSREPESAVPIAAAPAVEVADEHKEKLIVRSASALNILLSALIGAAAPCLALLAISHAGLERAWMTA